MEQMKNSGFGNQSPTRRMLSAKAFIVALLIMSLGLVLMLRNLDLLSNRTIEIIFSWPSLIVAIGLLNLDKNKGWFGFLLIIFGGFFLITDIYDLPVNFEKVFWPLLLILFGIVILFFGLGKFRMRRLSKSSQNENNIEEIQIFGGGERIFYSDAFEGGEILNVFGGSKLDFRPAKLKPGTHTLEMVLVFGGSSLIVPEDWNIKVEIVSVFGGFADKRYKVEADKSKTLIIKGVAIFGGGEIKTYE